MQRRQKKIKQDRHRWVISYADFITLLFAFFVVMYAISSVNDSKYKSLSKGMHSAFGIKKKSDVSTTSETQEEKSGQDAFKGLQAALKSVGNGDYRVNSQEGWIEIDIKAGALFIKGSAELKPEATLKLMKIANMLKNFPYPVALEGYTDNLPIETPTYPSNWELSAARAAAVGRILNSFGVSSDRISVTGFGEQFPIASNATTEGQARNRRVNILIAKDKNSPRFLNPEFKGNTGMVPLMVK